MSLLGRFIDQILPVGSITIIQPDDRRETHGGGGGKHVTVKLHDRRVAFDLFRNPRLRLGELYMDGRLTIEDGTILETHVGPFGGASSVLRTWIRIAAD